MTAGALPPGHQFLSPEKPTHPALHLYPHIHGHVPLHAVPHLPRPLIHPTLYTAPPFTHSKVSGQKGPGSSHVTQTLSRACLNRRTRKVVACVQQRPRSREGLHAFPFTVTSSPPGVWNLYSYRNSRESHGSLLRN